MHIVEDADTFTADALADYRERLRTPGLSVGSYSIPAGAADPQQPHTEDELYVVVSGRGRFVADTGTTDVGPGTVLFVPAGEAHRFADVTDDLTVLVVFGPAEGTRR